MDSAHKFTVRYDERRSIQRALADIYVPVVRSHKRSVIFVHGGAWLVGWRTMPAVVHLAQRLVHLGYVVVAPTYRQLFRGGAVRAAVADVKSALEWWHTTASEYGCDATQTSLIAASAGAATCVIAMDQGAPLPERFVGLYGPWDFDHLPFVRPGLLSRILLGGASRDKWVVPSPMDLEPLDLPVLLIHGTGDGLVPPAMTAAYAAKREAKGRPTQVCTYEGAPHGFFTWPDRPPFEEATADVLSFLDEGSQPSL